MFGKKVIYDKDGEKYLTRFYLVPKNNTFNVYLHWFHKGDDDRAPHDHPWHSWSVLLWGSMVEEIYDEFTGETDVRTIWPCYVYRRTPVHNHIIHLVSRRALTLFVTGRRTREWGFWTKKGWMHNEEFLNEHRD